MLDRVFGSEKDTSARRGKPGILPLGEPPRCTACTPHSSAPPPDIQKLLISHHDCHPVPAHSVLAGRGASQVGSSPKGRQVPGGASVISAAGRPCLWGELGCALGMRGCGCSGCWVGWPSWLGALPDYPRCLPAVRQAALPRPPPRCRPARRQRAVVVRAEAQQPEGEAPAPAEPKPQPKTAYIDELPEASVCCWPGPGGGAAGLLRCGRRGSRAQLQEPRVTSPGSAARALPTGTHPQCGRLHLPADQAHGDQPGDAPEAAQGAVLAGRGSQCGAPGGGRVVGLAAGWLGFLAQLSLHVLYRRALHLQPPWLGLLLGLVVACPHAAEHCLQAWRPRQRPLRPHPRRRKWGPTGS